MEVRCGNCSKLFRVSDDKITGTGIKFACSKCGEYVKITRQDFDHYQLSQATVSALASFVPKPKPAPASPGPAVEAASTASSSGFDLSESSAELTQESAAPAGFDLSEPPAAELTQDSAAPGGFDLSEPPAGEFTQEEAPPEFVKPIPSIEEALGSLSIGSPPKPAEERKPVEERKEKAAQREAAPEIKVEQKPAPVTIPKTTEQPVVVVKPSEPLIPASEPKSGAATAKSQAAPSGRGKRLLVLFAVLLIIAGAAIFGAQWYFGKTSQRVSEAIKAVTSPEGLQIKNAAGAIDSVNGDLVMTGTIENTTDKPRPAWYVVADVYNAQNTVILRAKLLNGKQVYTRRDYDIMAKRGTNIQEFKKNYLQQQGTIIPPKGSLNFEIRVMEPPASVASFNVTLQPFDPVQLFKEIAEDQKQE